MDNAEFDGFADEYRSLHQANVTIFGEALEYFAQYKVTALRAIVAGHGVQARHILDFGSGTGNSIPEFSRSFPEARLTCADVSQRSLNLATQRFPGLADNLRIEGDRLPVADSGFDVAFSACVFHHIAHNKHRNWLRELHSMTRPSGLLCVFEHNPLNPLTRYQNNTCPFDTNARLIRAGWLMRQCLAAGWTRPCVRFYLFFPRVLKALRGWERGLSWVAFGTQYSLTAMRTAGAQVI